MHETPATILCLTGIIRRKKRVKPPHFNFSFLQPKNEAIHTVVKMATATTVIRPLPVLPDGWSAEKDFKPIGSITASTQRTIEPVGPHFLAHARRARHKRTFSEDDRIQAQESAKKIEKDDESDVSEPEDPMMLQREAKDWKVSNQLISSVFYS